MRAAATRRNLYLAPACLAVLAPSPTTQPRLQRAVHATQAPSLRLSPLLSAPSALLEAQVFRARVRAPCVSLESMLLPKEVTRVLRALLVQLQPSRAPFHVQNAPLDSFRVGQGSLFVNRALEGNFRPRMAARRA